jgi:hypothetical protein
MWRRHDERLVQQGLEARAAESVRIPPGLLLGGKGIGPIPRRFSKRVRMPSRPSVRSTRGAKSLGRRASATASGERSLMGRCSGMTPERYAKPK